MSSGDQDLQWAVRRLVTSLVLHTLRPEEAVELAVMLVAAGAESGAAMELAMLPSDPRRLSYSEVEPLARAMLVEHGVVLPWELAPGWTMAGFVADAMMRGVIAPATGAWEIWRQWDVCGESGDELTGIFELHDSWQNAVGQGRTTIEMEMIAFASCSPLPVATRLGDPA